MICSNCSKENNENAIFCKYCGYKLSMIEENSTLNNDKFIEKSTRKSVWKIIFNISKYLFFVLMLIKKELSIKLVRERNPLLLPSKHNILFGISLMPFIYNFINKHYNLKSFKKILPIITPILIIVLLVSTDLIIEGIYSKKYDNSIQPYEKIENKIKSYGFKITALPSELIFQSNNETIFFNLNQNIGFSYMTSSKDYYLIYMKEYNSWSGGNENNTCNYIISSVLSNDHVFDGYTCNEYDKLNIKNIKLEFENLLQKLGITLDELLDFVEYYYYVKER